MKDFLLSSAQNPDLNWQNFVLAFLLSILLSVILIYTVKRTRFQYNPDRNFYVSLFILAPLVMSIIYFIGSSLSLSIGLLGSLSIIRFRTAIKNSLELIFFLWAIMIGIGLGSHNFVLTFVATIGVAVTLQLINSFIFKIKPNMNASIVSLNAKEDITKEINSVFKSLNLSYSFKSISFNQSDYLYQIELNDPKNNISSIFQKLSSIHLVTESNIIKIDD